MYRRSHLIVLISWKCGLDFDLGQMGQSVTRGFGASSGLCSPWKACTLIPAAQKPFYWEDGFNWGVGGGEGAYFFITNTSQQRSRFQRKFIVFERSEGDFTRV